MLKLASFFQKSSISKLQSYQSTSKLSSFSLVCATSKKETSNYAVNSISYTINRSFASAPTSGAKERKRFYRTVRICESNSNGGTKSFEILLDHRKLKTPGGKVFHVPNEKLAQLIAHEWRSQTYTIKQNLMHLTSLLNTCLDNPNKVTRTSLISNIKDYLDTDTLLYFDTSGSAKLEQLQTKKWLPLIGWMNERFEDLNLKVQRDLDLADMENQTEKTNEKITTISNKFETFLLENFDLNSLIAFNYMSECLKSVILCVALLEKRIKTVNEACDLAMLEQQHQYDQWGKVEWYHDINETEMVSRVSAALLFIYLSNSAKYFQTHDKSVKQYL